MNIKTTYSIVSLVLITARAACGSLRHRDTDNTVTRSGLGTVQSIDEIKKDDKALIGTIAGAVVGGVVGSQIGAGRGKTLGTIAGTAGGAIAGHEIEQHINKDHDYKLTIKMDDGTYQTVVQNTDNGLRSGDRVEVNQGRLVRF